MVHVFISYDLLSLLHDNNSNDFVYKNYISCINTNFNMFGDYLFQFKSEIPVADYG